MESFSSRYCQNQRRRDRLSLGHLAGRRRTKAAQRIQRFPCLCHAWSERLLRRQSQWFCYCRIAKGHPCRRYYRRRRHLRRQRHEPLPLAEQASRRTQRFRNDRNRALRLLCCEPFHANPRRHFERHSYGAGAGLRRKNL